MVNLVYDFSTLTGDQIQSRDPLRLDVKSKISPNLDEIENEGCFWTDFSFGCLNS